MCINFQEACMTSVEEFYVRYYANRLLREGCIDGATHRALLAAMAQGMSSTCVDAPRRPPV